MPDDRLSAEWMDRSWVDGTAAFPGSAGDLGPILQRSLEGLPPTTAEVEALFRAGETRSMRWPMSLTYFGSRWRRHRHLCGEPEHQLHQSLLFPLWVLRFLQGTAQSQSSREPYLMGLDEIVERAVEAWGEAPPR